MTDSPTETILKVIEDRYSSERSKPKLITSDIMHRITGIEEAQCSGSLGILVRRGVIKVVGVLDKNRFVYQTILEEEPKPTDSQSELLAIVEQFRVTALRSTSTDDLLAEVRRRVNS